jgi:hypothetical protein
VLGLLPQDREVSIGRFRGIILREFPDLEVFKYEHVLPDLIDAGLLHSRFIRTDEGVDAMEGVRTVLTFIEREIDELVTNDRDTLIANLNALGSNVVLLDGSTRNRLHDMLMQFPELKLSVNLGSNVGSAVPFDTFTAFDTLSFGASFDGGAVDFGSFGEGIFGGGGAGGDW